VNAVNYVNDFTLVAYGLGIVTETWFESALSTLLESTALTV
jgi:hypothetical protein